LIKVLHLSTPKSWRGGEQQLAYLLQYLPDDIENSVLCPKDSVLFEYCRVHGHQHEALSTGPAWKRASKLRAYCLKNGIQLIHTHDSKAHTLAFLGILFLRMRIPVIVSRRVDFKSGRNILSKKKYNHPLIRKIICVSDAIRDIMKTAINDPQKLISIHSGADLEKFKGLTKPENGMRASFKLSEDSILIGNTSALADHKDYYTFLDTAEIVLDANPEVHFIIIGSGPLEKEIREYASKKDHHERIHFSGFIKDAYKYLNELDLFFISSKTEGLGTSIIDAQAAGLPVVATRAGGIPEIVNHEETGLLADVGDSKELAKQISRILNDTELKEKIINGASDQLTRFDARNTAQKTAAVYKEILSGS